MQILAVPDVDIELNPLDSILVKIVFVCLCVCTNVHTHTHTHTCMRSVYLRMSILQKYFVHPDIDAVLLKYVRILALSTV